MDGLLAPLSGKSRQPDSPSRFVAQGYAQLSLVEHALCPLDTGVSLRPNLVHETQYRYTDAGGDSKTATARVFSPLGLSPHDEFYLWALLAMSLAQSEPSPEFLATPHYCLRQLGCIDAGAGRGGKQYASFREAIRRLSAVVYQNDAFFDPLRGEMRQVSFNFLSYSLPLDAASARAWRFAWNPMFWEMCRAIGGRLTFDLSTYRELDLASRRLFLLLKKVFWRRPDSPYFDVGQLAVNVLGFAPTVAVWDLKAKVRRCAMVLEQHGIITLPEADKLFRKQTKGRYTVRFRRGPYFDNPEASAARSLTDSPLYDPLRKIGLEDAAIKRLLQQHSSRMLEEWADITLAAVERSVIKKSPQAYFVDNVQNAAQGRRTPPDWWHDLRREEERQRRTQAAETRVLDREHEQEHAFDEYLRDQAHAAFEGTMDRIFQQLRTSGQAEVEARQNAEYIARMHLRRQFLREHPDLE